MSEMQVWREFRPAIEWVRPPIGNTGMRDAPISSVSDTELDAENGRASAALEAAKTHGERAGLRLGLDGRRMDAQERDAVYGELQLAREAVQRISDYTNRIAMERGRREAVRERDEREARARARLAELETVRGEAVA